MKRDVYLSDRPLGEALRGYLDVLSQAGALDPGPPVLINTEEAAGRVTAAAVYAVTSSPHYHASAMDGVAVSSMDTFGASETTPKRLRVGAAYAEGGAVVVDTGDPVPPGCDAVIMIEDVHFISQEEFEIISAAVPWQHVRVIGEDVVATEMIVPGNHRLRPYDLGGILAGGVTQVLVHPAPRVALLPTGSELVQPGSPLKTGDIVEYNTRMFSALVSQWGGEPQRFDITPDEYGQLKSSLLKALEQADVVVINAGSSAGRDDYTAHLIREVGEVFTHGVAIKPGKPVVLGLAQGKPVLGIPGYPVSAVLCMELFMQPIIYSKLGSPVPARAVMPALVSRKMVSSLGVEEFVRVKLGRVGEKVVATPISRGAGVIMSMVRADGIIRIPGNSEGFKAGESAPVELLRPLEEVNQTTVVIGSHDIALDVLANHLRRRHPEATLSSAHVGSLGGLSALKRNEAHCAGTHLLDEASGEYNVSYVKRLLPDRGMALINLVHREQGLIVAPGNPKGIKGVSDLARPEISYVNRQRGAGTRILLDYKIAQAGVDPDSIRGYEREEYTHMAVAAAVASGSSDAGMGIRAAARALGLDFVSVVEERYDLLIPLEYLGSLYITRLLEVMALPEFRQEVEALGGYDTRDCGKIMWQGGPA